MIEFVVFAVFLGLVNFIFLMRISIFLVHLADMLKRSDTEPVVITKPNKESGLIDLDVAPSYAPRFDD